MNADDANLIKVYLCHLLNPWLIVLLNKYFRKKGLQQWR